MNKFEIEWFYGFDHQKQDAVWFYGSTIQGTARLTTAEGVTYSLDIYCDGETKYRIPYENEDGTWDRDNTEVIRYADEWEARGVHTDKDLEAEYQKWQERGVDIHIYNSWFDLYTEIDGVSQHLDAVTHTQDEAEDAAVEILSEVAAVGGWSKYLEQR